MKSVSYISFKAIFFSTLIILFTLSCFAVEEEDNQPKVDFYVETPKNLPGVLAVVFKNKSHWHTYWKNPGDAGTPTSISFKVNNEPVKFEEYPWPAPLLFKADGDIHGLGYENNYSFFFKLPEVDSLEGKSLSINARWLGCKHICIPGMKTVTGHFNVGLLELDISPKFHIKNESLKSYFNNLPAIDNFPTDIDLTVERKDNNLILYYTISPTNFSSNSPRYILTPYINKLFTFSHELLFRDKKGNLYGKMSAEWDGELEEPPIKLPENGKFDPAQVFKFLITSNSKTIIATKKIKTFSTKESTSLEQLFSILTPINSGNPKSTDSILVEDDAKENVVTSFNFQKLLTYLLFAFIGGLILNLMPCVLPVISLKLFGLIKHQNSSKGDILKHNLAYTFGILITFLALSLIIIGVKSSGELIGWGFQLQSPTFLLVMIFSIFIFGLNMFGLFEFITPGGKSIGNQNVKSGFLGDVLGGIFATILSTPCSAPFLGTALTFAFTSGPLTLVFIFQAVGIGLAAPFLLTGFFPRLVRFLPRPGLWMDNLKKFLGLTLILTVIWLIDVLSSSIIDPNSMLLLNLTLTGIFFTIFFNSKISKKIYFKIIPLAITILLLLSLFKSLTPISTASVQNGTIKVVGELNWEPWSREKLKQLKTSKELVFIDFTADWCFTCKVNEKLVLHTDDFKALVLKHNVKLLLGDFTRKDPAIASWLKEQDLFGVPAYFILTKDGKLIKLGELISIDELKNIFETN